MKLYLKDLTSHLQNHLAPIYLINSDEILLLREARDSIRQRAEQLGYSERQQFSIEAQFDWDQLTAETQTLSLFSEKRIFELNFQGSVNEKAQQWLQVYAKQPAPDLVLIVMTTKLDTKSQKSRWFQVLEEAGITLTIWPIERNELPRWLKQRAHAQGLTLDEAACQFLTDYTEGNLLAAQQELEKLSLLKGKAKITGADIQMLVNDHSHFDIFKFVDAALEADKARAVRLLSHLKAEGEQPPILLWAIARELRMLHHVAHGLESGESFHKLSQQFRIWDKRKPQVEAVLKRKNTQQIQRLLQKTCEIDEIIKGAMPGNCWEALTELCMAI